MTPVELKDPVCGMTVKPDSPRRLVHRGTTYGFCSDRCLEKFRASPQTYVGDAAPPAPAPLAAAWTCPMHPEIVRDRPGACPICGMALEPVSGAAEGPDPELIDMTRRFWVSALLTLPVF